MIRFTFLFLFTSAILAWGQSPSDSTYSDGDSVFTGDTIVPGDSSASLSSPTDSNAAKVAAVADSSAKPKPEIAPADSSHQKKLTPAKHVYDRKHMVYLAAGMMAFIAILFSTTQMWNPR